MLKEKAAYYYGTLGKGCGEAILLAANDVYDLKLSEEAIQLFAGFRTGMGCGSTCGGLSGAIGVLSRMYGQREDFKDLCAAFVKAFEEKLGCGSADCTPIAAKYKTEEARCVAAVELGAQALEDFIDKTEGREKQAPAEGCTLTADQIKAVKAQGFLHQKGTNKFNGRIITRNGRITEAEARAIADAAKRYGDGYVMMTTRLTMEVSGIPFEKTEAFRTDMAKAGLQVGGTGSIATIEDPAQPLLEVSIKEFDINRLKTGQAVNITTGAQDTFSGTVSRIAPKAQENSSGESLFPVQIRFSDATEAIKLGMSAKAQIVLDSRENVFVVPLAALGTDQEGNPVVYAKQPDGSF